MAFKDYIHHLLIIVTGLCMLQDKK